MTPKEKHKYNMMRHALIRISKFDSPTKLMKNSEKEWGLEFDEAIQMAYENVLSSAKFAVKGIREIK